MDDPTKVSVVFCRYGDAGWTEKERQAAVSFLLPKGLAMGIFSNDDNGPPRRMRSAVKEHTPAAGIRLQVPCDRCHVALAQVEVITHAGPVFLCQHHHLEHRTSIIAAGYPIRRR